MTSDAGIFFAQPPLRNPLVSEKDECQTRGNGDETGMGQD